MCRGQHSKSKTCLRHSNFFMVTKERTAEREREREREKGRKKGSMDGVVMVMVVGGKGRVNEEIEELYDITGD